jgi:hypothetical protein
MTEQEIPEWAWCSAAKRYAKFERVRSLSIYMGGETLYGARVLVSPSEAIAELNRNQDNQVTDEMVGRAWAMFCEELTRSRDYSADDLTPNGIKRILEAAFAQKEHHVPNQST